MNTTTLIALAAALIVYGLFRRFGPGAAASYATLRGKIGAGARIIDVRTTAEFETGHVKGAINIPLDEIAQRIDDVGERPDPIVLYCRTGARCNRALAILRRHGFSDVVNGGGIDRMRAV